MFTEPPQLSNEILYVVSTLVGAEFVSGLLRLLRLLRLLLLLLHLLRPPLPILLLKLLTILALSRFVLFFRWGYLEAPYLFSKGTGTHNSRNMECQTCIGTFSFGRVPDQVWFCQVVVRWHYSIPRLQRLWSGDDILRMAHLFQTYVHHMAFPAEGCFVSQRKSFSFTMGLEVLADIHEHHQELHQNGNRCLERVKKNWMKYGL